MARLWDWLPSLSRLIRRVRSPSRLLLTRLRPRKIRAIRKRRKKRPPPRKLSRPKKRPRRRLRRLKKMFLLLLPRQRPSLRPPKLKDQVEMIAIK
jgi:hypothetical protein